MELPGELWLAQADYDLSVAQLLYQQEVYRYCVFFCHLALEKALKAMLMDILERDEPPHTHVLDRLARMAGIDIPEEYDRFITDLSNESVSARYPEPSDVYNEEIAADVLSQPEEVYEWLKSRTVF